MKKGHKLTNDSTIAELKNLSVSELNSFLLELFREKALSRSPSEILEQYRNNRFVTPSDIDALSIRNTELEWLKISNDVGFLPIVLSPLAPLGASSSIGYVHQNNVLSALRGTEVISDATNVLALQIAEDFRINPGKEIITRYSTVHRHVRGQAFDNPKFSAHFSTFCLASGGFDVGNFDFELSELQHHLSLTFNILLKYFDVGDLALKLYLKKNSEVFKSRLLNESLIDQWGGSDVELIEDFQHEYYQLIQFKVFVSYQDIEYNIADGGFVDWTRKLLNNHKHRCMISGIGIELLHRLMGV